MTFYYFPIFIRKVRSIIFRLSGWLRTTWVRVLILGNPAISLGAKCSFGRSVSLRTTDGGSISIGSGSHVSDNVQIVVRGGQLTISEDVFIGTGCIIVCMNNIVIGRDSQIAELVVIRDQDHRTDSTLIRLGGFITSPIFIGENVWIGCKATLLRGAVVGDRCVIGAHALVKSAIPDDTLAVGLPSRVVKHLKKRPNF